jgi:hypothetical protein
MDIEGRAVAGTMARRLDREASEIWEVSSVPLRFEALEAHRKPATTIELLPP